MMKRLITLCLFLIFTSCSSNPNKDKSLLYYSIGTNALVDKDYTAALDNLLKAYELSPKDSDTCNNLGMAYYFKGDKIKAENFIRKSIDLNSKNSDAKLNLANLFSEQGKLDEAEELYQQILKDLVYPRQFRTYYNLGLIELRRQNGRAAQNYFELAIKENENYCPAHFELGKIFYQMKDFNKALDGFKNASYGLCFSDPAPHYYAGLMYVRLGKWSKAKEKFELVISKNPNSAFAGMAQSELPNVEQQLLSQKSQANEDNDKLKTIQSAPLKNELEAPEF